MLYECTISSLGIQTGHEVSEHTVPSHIIASLNGSYTLAHKLHPSIVCISGAVASKTLPHDPDSRHLSVVAYLTLHIDAADSREAARTPVDSDAISAIVERVFPEVTFGNPWDLLTVQALTATERAPYELARFIPARRIVSTWTPHALAA